MKKLLFVLSLLIAHSASAQLTNLTFVWDVSANATGYRFYELSGTGKTLLGTSPTNGILITNWNVSIPHTVTVTATNALGESAQAVPLTVPAAPAPVQNLKLVPLTIVSPCPGTIEISRDLVDWNQRLRFAMIGTSNLSLTWVQYPTEPLMFMRAKANPAFTVPMAPTIR